MSGYNLYKHQFKELRCCVLIPTYNNATKLADVLSDVSQYSDDICVVNDGSTDATLDILRSFPEVRLYTYPENRGKGWALRKGFEFARDQGYDYAITIDSDGQHYADDLPVFLGAIEQDPKAIYIGARNMEQSSVPGKSSFGNKFSNFWFRFETGIDLPDTQSGYRLYPIRAMEGMIFFTVKYEFEVEVIVRCAWRGIGVNAVPVKVYYPPADERITHFRPFQDFSRISVLNTVLVFFALIWYKPRNFIRHILSQNIKTLISEYITSEDEPALIKALSVGVGIFLGIAPLWGLQIILALAISWLLRLNKAITVLTSNISIPPMIPLILWASYRTGGLISHPADTEQMMQHSPVLSVIYRWLAHVIDRMHISDASLASEIIRNLTQYIIGSIALATVAGLITTTVTFVLVKVLKNK
jgi:glycosyltransferase involved in cell wall biosynthesis